MRLLVLIMLTSLAFEVGCAYLIVHTLAPAVSGMWSEIVDATTP